MLDGPLASNLSFCRVSARTKSVLRFMSSKNGVSCRATAPQAIYGQFFDATMNLMNLLSATLGVDGKVARGEPRRQLSHIDPPGIFQAHADRVCTLLPEAKRTPALRSVIAALEAAKLKLRGLLRCSGVAKDERGLKHALAVGSHLDCDVLPFIQAGEIARQPCQRFRRLDFSFTLSRKLQPLLVRIEPGAVPDVEIIARHRIVL